MAEITVLMAAYNTEQYLGRALDSILAQTFQDFEIRIIDDGSTDSTGTIADGYARADSRLHVRHQSNMGTCTTKNNLLDWTYAESGSRWLLFFDSDDWAHPEMLERLLNAAVEHKVRISACGYEETAGDDPVVRPEDLQPVLWDPMEFYKTHFINASMACCKLYHRDCYEYIRHPKKGYFDDEFVCYRLLFQEPQMAVIPAPLYAYFINPKGVTKRSWTPECWKPGWPMKSRSPFSRKRVGRIWCTSGTAATWTTLWPTAKRPDRPMTARRSGRPGRRSINPSSGSCGGCGMRMPSASGSTMTFCMPSTPSRPGFTGWGWK